jgi:hypothetical protein
MMKIYPADTNTGWNCDRKGKLLRPLQQTPAISGTGLCHNLKAVSGHPNRMAQNRQVRLEVRPPTAVEENYLKKMGGGKAVSRHPFSFPNIFGNRKRRLTKPFTGTKLGVIKYPDSEIPLYNAYNE